MSEMCSLDGEACRVPWAATPSMDLLSVQIIMNRRGMNQVPVVTEQFEDNGGNLVGLLDRECISLTCRLVCKQLISIPIRITTFHFPAICLLTVVPSSGGRRALAARESLC